MNSNIEVIKFDYSRYEAMEGWKVSILNEYEFWGLHNINGRIYVDIQRYVTACNFVGIDEFVPEELLKQDKSVLFIPDKQHRDDYIVNIFCDLLNNFEKDWNTEYKPIFKNIKTPEEVHDDVRLNDLVYTSSPDDLDEIESDAIFSSLKRQYEYNWIIQALYCQFIIKLATEVDRITLIAMCKLGYKGNNYNFNSFAKFTDGLARNRTTLKISQLDKYNAYNMLHKINNFLKHNTICSYMDLKKYYPNNVLSIEKGTTDMVYENGMFAGDWIIIKDGYIDDLIRKLKTFFKRYCEIFVNENVEEANWNYDDYFIYAYKEMKNPWEYFGI